MAYNGKTNWQFGETVTETDLNRIEQGIKTLDLDKAGYSDLNGAINAKTIDGAVRVATTANITLSGLQTIDGVALAAGDRVLVKNQTTGSQNGIYVAASGAWARAADADSTAKIAAGISVYVREGTAGGGKTYIMSNTSAVTLGTTAITFAQNGGADSATDAVIGSRTISDATAPTGDSGSITTLFGWLANMIKAITGGASWRTAPVKSLAALNTEKAPIASPTFSGTATAPSFASTAATGTAPFVVTSTTTVTNLNADMVDGLHSATAATPSTIMARDSAGDAWARVITSSAPDGTQPMWVTSKTLVTNLNADMVDGLHTTTAATANTVAARDSVGILSAYRFVSTVASATAAPFDVASTTTVTNLSADMVDGLHADTGAVNSTIAARTSTGDLRSATLTSTVATGTAPLTVASTTIVTNLNADLVDGYHADSVASSNTVAVRNASGQILANEFHSTGTGTASGRLHFTLRNDAGDTRIGIGLAGVETGTDNAGSDLTFYKYSDDTTVRSPFLRVTRATGRAVFSVAPSSSYYESTAATGSAPLIVASTTLVTNLNADMVDGYHVSTTGTTANSIPYRDGSAVISANRFNSMIATGTAPFSVMSTTIVTNLNADMVDGYHASAFSLNTDYVRQPGYGAAYSGGANDYAVTLTPALPSYAYGAAVAIRINEPNTGSATLNVNGLGPKHMLDSKGKELVAGALVMDSVYTFRYNGTAFILQGEGGGINVLTLNSTAASLGATKAVTVSTSTDRAMQITIPLSAIGFTPDIVRMQSNTLGAFIANLSAIGYTTPVSCKNLSVVVGGAEENFVSIGSANFYSYAYVSGSNLIINFRFSYLSGGLTVDIVLSNLASTNLSFYKIT